MNTSISSAAMSVDSNGYFGILGAKKVNNLKTNRGIKSLLEIYRALFRIPKNLSHYSERDYRTAERKFLKYALEQRSIEMEEELFGE